MGPQGYNFKEGSYFSAVSVKVNNWRHEKKKVFQQQILLRLCKKNSAEEEILSEETTFV